MAFLGQLVGVTRVKSGVELAAAASSGSGVLSVVSALDLPEDGGVDLVLPDGALVSVLSADHDSGSVSLAEPLPVALGEGEWLSVSGVMGAVATVEVDGGTVEARVPHALRSLLPDGFEQPDQGAPVTLDIDRSGALSLVDLHGVMPVEVWGDPDGARAEMSEAGLRLFSIGPNGEPYPNVQMTTSGLVSFGVMGDDGTLLGGVMPDGSLSGPSASILDDLTLRGVPLLGLMGGGSVQGWLDRFPRGLVAKRENAGNTQTVAVGVEARNIAVSYTLLPGRQYRVSARMSWRSNKIDGVLRLRIRWTDDGTYPTTSSPELGIFGVSGPTYTGSVTHTASTEGLITVDEPTSATFLITYQGMNGTGPTREDSIIYVEDIGQPVTETGGDEGDTGAEVEYTSTWQATASRMYHADGSPVAGSDGTVGQWYWYGEPPDFQQCAWVYGGGVVDSSHGAEVGKSLPTALSGATITKAEVYVRNKVWYGTSQGFVTFNTLNSASLPAAKVITEASPSEVALLVAGGGYWTDVPTSWFTGTNRGVTMGDKDGETLGLNLTSGAFHGINDTDPPLLRLTYTRAS